MLAAGSSEAALAFLEVGAVVLGLGLLARLAASELSPEATFTCILDCCESSSLLRELPHELQLREPTDR